MTESENVKAQVRRGYCIVTKPNVRYAAGTYLRIPKEIDGYAVREIEKWAFVDSHELVGVEIPDGVVEIGSGAFYCCTGLKGVIIPGSVKEIRKSTFAKCTGLEIVTVKKGIERIEAYAFSECRNLKSVILPDTITYIDDLAFGTGLSADCTIYASPATIKRLKLKNRSWSLQAKVQPSK